MNYEPIFPLDHAQICVAYKLEILLVLLHLLYLNSGIELVKLVHLSDS